MVTVKHNTRHGGTCFLCGLLSIRLVVGRLVLLCCPDLFCFLLQSNALKIVNIILMSIAKVALNWNLSLTQKLLNVSCLLLTRSNFLVADLKLISAVGGTVIEQYNCRLITTTYSLYTLKITYICFASDSVGSSWTFN